jgi:CubicO group peptidase (beta-lactamase class C family)
MEADVTIHPERFAELVSRMIHSGEWGTGAQAVIIEHGQRILDLALGTDGVGKAIDPESVFPIYCAGKPIITAAVARLIDLGELSMHDQIGHILDAPLADGLKPLTIDSLLTHRAGLHHPAPSFLLHSPANRDLAVRSLTPLPIQQAGAGIYSEYAAWHLLALVIEALTGQHFEAAVAELVLDRLGIREHIAYRLPKPARARLRINIDLRDVHKGIPLLWERTDSNLDDIRPAGGAHATMSALAALYEDLRMAWLSGPTTGVRQLAQTTTIDAYDPVLGRRCLHGGGFMIKPAQHEFAMSDDAFGHTGLAGLTVAFTDPATALTVAVHTNGITYPTSTRPLQRRRLMFESLAH